MNEQQQPDSEEQGPIEEFFKDLAGGMKVTGVILLLSWAKGLCASQNRIIDRVFGKDKK